MEIPQLYAFDERHTPYHENFNNALRAIVELTQEVNALKAEVEALKTAPQPKGTGRK